MSWLGLFRLRQTAKQATRKAMVRSDRVNKLANTAIVVVALSALLVIVTMFSSAAGDDTSSYG
jgi:hypothetical protein